MWDESEKTPLKLVYIFTNTCQIRHSVMSGNVSMMSHWKQLFIPPFCPCPAPPPQNQFRCCRSGGGDKNKEQPAAWKRVNCVKSEQWKLLSDKSELVVKSAGMSAFFIAGTCWLVPLQNACLCKWDWPADMGSPSHSQPLRRLYKEFVKVLSGPRVLFPILRFCFAGVSCDACLKGNFRGRRFKCLICYDYDLCASCYESGATTTRHTTEHPMQCILTRVDYGKDLTLWVSDYMHDRHACCTGWWYC